jgi:hypothetical protein
MDNEKENLKGWGRTFAHPWMVMVLVKQLDDSYPHEF